MDTPNNTRNIIIILAIIAALGFAAYSFMGQGAHILPIADGDSITSWDFDGSHDDGGANEERARSEITRLEGGALLLLFFPYIVNIFLQERQLKLLQRIQPLLFRFR